MAQRTPSSLSPPTFTQCSCCGASQLSLWVDPLISRSRPFTTLPSRYQRIHTQSGVESLRSPSSREQVPCSIFPCQPMTFIILSPLSTRRVPPAPESKRKSLTTRRYGGFKCLRLGLLANCIAVWAWAFLQIPDCALVTSKGQPPHVHSYQDKQKSPTIIQLLCSIVGS